MVVEVVVVEGCGEDFERLMELVMAVEVKVVVVVVAVTML